MFGKAMFQNADDKMWYKDGVLHREDGPAVSYPNGDEEYWLHGVKYKIIEKKKGKTSYWASRFDQSVIHREDGPAIEWDNGVKEWYIDGLPHREDGPAYISPNNLNGSILFENWLFKERPIEKMGLPLLDIILGLTIPWSSNPNGGYKDNCTEAMARQKFGNGV